MSSRAVVLVDGGYYSKGINPYLQRNRGEKVDLYELSTAVCDHFGLSLLRTKFYTSFPPDPDPDKQSFLDTIDNLPKHQFVEKGRVKDHHSHCPDCGNDFTYKKQKGVDVGIAVDLVEMGYRNPPEAFVLIAGDEDLTHAVRATKDLICNVYLAFIADSDDGEYVSRVLTQEVDDALHMELDFLENCKLEE